MARIAIRKMVRYWLRRAYLHPSFRLVQELSEAEVTRPLHHKNEPSKPLAISALMRHLQLQQTARDDTARGGSFGILIHRRTPTDASLL